MDVRFSIMAKKDGFVSLESRDVFYSVWHRGNFRVFWIVGVAQHDPEATGASSCASYKCCRLFVLVGLPHDHLP